MRQAKALLLTIATLSLAGCAAGPQYTLPTVPLTPAFASAVGFSNAPGSVAEVDLVRWWQSFDDPLLTSLIEQALAENLDLQQASARVVQARAALRHANADRLPSAVIGGHAATSYQSLETPLGRIASAQPGYERQAETYDLGIGASWELDVFGGQDAARDAVWAEWQASAAGATAARLAIVAQTADSYILMRGLQARLAVARDQRRVKRDLVNLVRRRHAYGLAADWQLREAEGALAQVSAAVPDMESSLTASMNALDVLVGLQPGSLHAQLAVPAAIPLPPALGEAEGPPALLRRRPDIIAAERRLAAANARIGVAMAEYYPKFSLNGLLGSAAMGTGGLLSGNGVQASGILGLRWRLFDFGRVDAEIAAARGRNAEALAAYRLAVLRACEDVENAFSRVARQQERTRLLASGSSSLASARTTALAAYEGGIADLGRVIAADQQLFESRDAELQAQIEESRAAVASFLALGGGWEPSGR